MYIHTEPALIILDRSLFTIIRRRLGIKTRAEARNEAFQEGMKAGKKAKEDELWSEAVLHGGEMKVRAVLNKEKDTKVLEYDSKAVHS